MPRLSAPERHRRALLAALHEAGRWTNTEVFRWAVRNGGTRRAYAALRELDAAGRVVYYQKTSDTPAHWLPIVRYDPRMSQITGKPG